jgi:ribosomal protein S18 acetylase RimI-like enzyme
VPSDPIDVYVEAFVSRCAIEMRPGDSALELPGAWGVLSTGENARIRALVTDDRAHDRVAALLTDVRAGMVNVLRAASRCDDLLRNAAGWKTERPTTAMVHRDLSALARHALPGELTFRAVRRLDDDPTDGVPLNDAAALAALADPGITDPPETFADYLRSLAPTTRLFAAVDGSGAVRATSGAAVVGAEASVLFVNTEPSWRGRGIARAMTAAALQSAQLRGARRASLVATDVGVRLYLSLGFEAAGRMTRFFRAA